MHPVLQQLVAKVQARRTNPPLTPSQALQQAIVRAGHKGQFTEGDLILAAQQLGIDPSAFLEELASWL